MITILKDAIWKSRLAVEKYSNFDTLPSLHNKIIVRKGVEFVPRWEMLSLGPGGSQVQRRHSARGEMWVSWIQHTKNEDFGGLTTPVNTESFVSAF